MSANEAEATARNRAVEIEPAERGAAGGNHVKKKWFLGLNKYALVGSVLASTNSILLGYGQFFLPIFEVV